LTRSFFKTCHGLRYPAVSEVEIREIDRIAVEDACLGILQMMENAGRNLAHLSRDYLGGSNAAITVLAGKGGNGGGGLCAARHLQNHAVQVNLLLVDDLDTYRGPAKTQLDILQSAGVFTADPTQAENIIGSSALIIDALIGYSLQGPPRGLTAELIEIANRSEAPILALDIPSGLDATHGNIPGVCIQADMTLTLALPKSGLQAIDHTLYLADIGIPHQLYNQLDLNVPPFPPGEYTVEIIPER
jgi:NAD(P)H-hydrate epimerase